MLNSYRRLVVLAIGALVVVGAALILINKSGSHFAAGERPPSDVERTISTYVQSSEDAVGSDQSSPISWINSVSQIVTRAWLSKISPAATSTSNVPAEYYSAHQNGYSVKTKISDCVWASQPIAPTAARGFVFCSVTDTTVDRSGSTVPDRSLPFGWTRSGAQPPVTVELIKTNGNWLINDITTST